MHSFIPILTLTEKSFHILDFNIPNLRCGFVNLKRVDYFSFSKEKSTYSIFLAAILPTYSIFNAINMSTYSVFRFINWRNLDFFTRLRQLITYFEASAISAARSSSLIPLRILSKSSVLLTVCGTLSKYELYSCILGRGYAPIYFDVTSLLVLCAILLSATFCNLVRLRKQI